MAFMAFLKFSKFNCRVVIKRNKLPEEGDRLRKFFFMKFFKKTVCNLFILLFHWRIF